MFANRRLRTQALSDRESDKWGIHVIAEKEKFLMLWWTGCLSESSNACHIVSTSRHRTGHYSLYCSIYNKQRAFGYL